MLVVVTEVNRQKHLQDSGEGRTWGVRGSIRDTSRRASERESERERLRDTGGLRESRVNIMSC